MKTCLNHGTFDVPQRTSNLIKRRVPVRDRVYVGKNTVDNYAKVDFKNVYFRAEERFLQTRSHYLFRFLFFSS